MSSPATPTSPRSLAWFADGDEGGGIASGLVNLAAECARRGHRVSVILLTDGRLARRARQAGLEPIVLGLPLPRNFEGPVWRKVARLAESIRYRQRHAPTIAERFRAAGAETVHVLSPNLLPLACRVARLLGARCIWEMPNVVSDRIPFQLNRRIYRSMIRRHRVLVLADSAFTAATIAGPGVTPIVFYHAADARQFDPDRVVPADRALMGVPPDAVLAGIVARLVPDKGQAEAVEAIALLGDAYPGLHLAIVGGPSETPFATRLRARVDELGLGRRVHLVGHVDDPSAHLAALDFAISARTTIEPFGLSVVEAQLMRKPVLVHALGGPAEIVVDGTTGWHIDGASGAHVADGIRRALSDRNRWPMMGDAGRNRALTTFSASALTDRYLALLLETRRG